ncbi:MAG TPA: hypothetical protein VGK46_11245 [Saprospiraceae bacterium]
MKKIITIVIVAILVFFTLQIFVKSLRFDFINKGGRLASSASKEEAIERGVYVCNVHLVSFHKNDGDLKFEITEGWVEINWNPGVWYWTTKPDSTGYTLKFFTTLDEDEENKLVFTNNRQSEWGFEHLGCYGEGCAGHLSYLPENDTIRFNLRKVNNLDFSKENIIGELVLVLKRE